MNVTAGEASQFQEGVGRNVRWKQWEIVVYKVEGKFYAIERRCTHRGGPLDEGELCGLEITCPWHGAKFSLESGEALSRPAPKGVRVFPVTLEENHVKIDVSQLS